MKKILGIFMITIFLSQCGTMKPNFEVRSGQNPAVFKKTLKKEIMVNYLIHLPENYKKDGQSFPMLVFLHGAGERGNDIEKVKAWGPPKIAENDKSFPYVLVSPQCPEGDWWSNPSQLENLYVLITAVMENYNVDKSKVYLTGLSMGGYGTWALAIQHPELFAAIAPICGGGQPRMTRNLVDIPTWVFHGAKDTVVPINESENMVNALKKFGGNVKFTVFPEATHNSWTQAYNETDLLTWFLKYQK